jgi:hypothetical protein
MMSGLLPLHRIERRLAALVLVLRVFLSNTFTGDTKWPTRTKIVAFPRYFVRLSLVQRIDPAP